MRIVFLVQVLMATFMTVDSKKIRHLTTAKKVSRIRTSSTTTTARTKPPFQGRHDYDFTFPFPTTEYLEKIYDTMYEYPYRMDSQELSAMCNPPDNISDYEKIRPPPAYYDTLVTFFNHKERNFKQEVLFKLNTSFLEPIHLNLTEDPFYWRIINKVPEKYWPDKEHVYNLHIVSHKFEKWPHNKRHAMVHEALRDEMLKREAGCAIDIHADTPEEWNEFKIRNDFDEVSGKPDWRARSLKTTPKLVIDTKLRDKVYNYIKLHFRPVVLHVVDSKHMHPVDNDNPAFDVLLVSHHFCNLTITQRTMLMHDYLRDFINEGIQFRLHCLQSPEEVWPERFNEDGIESALLTPIHNLREYMNVYKRYVPPPTHVVNLNYNMINKISVLEEAKRKLREHDEMMKAPG